MTMRQVYLTADVTTGNENQKEGKEIKDDKERMFMISLSSLISLYS